MSASLLVLGIPSLAHAAPDACTDTVSKFAAGTVNPGCGTTSPSPTPSASSTGVPGVDIGSDGWITYSDDATTKFGITGTVKTVNGSVQTDGTCQFDGSTTSSSSGTSYEQEVGYNPSTCQERVLTGTITPNQEASLASPADTNDTPETPQSASSTGDASDTVTPAAQPYNESGAAEAASSTPYSNAHTKTAWIDPVNITITSLTTNLRWPLYGHVGTLSARNNAYKFKYDGWSTSGTPQPKFSYQSDGWGTGGAETFKNTDFEKIVLFLLGPSGWASCGFSTDTAVFKHNVHVYGKKNGSRVSAWHDSKAGGCSNLVHHRTSNGFGWTS
ncbi:hypothetical protein [Streptomyces sp. HUAS TT20]|uniref:hypothetical protein n=1 Tax=Streptomyces sp. HUAS TT20 TaxID=3447509 RepID=UPI0021D7D3CA|nr:hypothetical protein [Streptomyces sp. HUAS 15-9]UXY27189.1 hypothetical protein N8I87_11690 [Streptomyces sp. HUAS 15-9]